MAGETKGDEYFYKILSLFGIDRADAVAIEVKYHVNNCMWVKINGLHVTPHLKWWDKKEFADNITLLMERLGVDDNNTAMFHLEASVDSAMTYTATQLVDKNRVRF